MGYSKQAFKGVSWLTALRVSTRGLTVIKTSILARILTPGQFGVFGVATLLLALLEIFTETGINVFLVQQKEELGEYVNEAWVVSILRGFFLSLLLFLLAPFIAVFFKSPDSLQIIQLMSIVPFARGFINPSIVRLQKDLTFDKEFWFRLSIFVADSFVSVAISFIKHDISGLGWGMFAGVLLEVLLSFYLIRPRPKLALNFEKVKKIIHRGKWVTAYGICNYFGENGDNIVVGRLLGTAPLGIYQVAYKFSTLPISEITDVSNRVAFPVYTKIADDKRRLAKAFIRTTVFISMGSIILGAIIYFFATPIILLFLGNAWQSAIPVVKVLALYGVLRAISGSASSLFLAVQKQEYVATMIFVRFLGLAITIVPFTTSFGLIGAGYSALISVMVEIPVILFFVFRIFGSKNYEER